MSRSPSTGPVSLIWPRCDVTPGPIQVDTATLDAVHDLNEFIAGAAGGCSEPVEEPARLIRAGGDPP